MSIERRISTKLRQALDTAYNNGELSNYWPFSKFPDDCCEHTCDILAYLLSVEKIKTVQINGVCRKDSSRHHVWLETETGVVIDITESQFAGKLLDETEVEIVRVGTEGPAQKLFSKSRIKQPHTIFTDPREYTGFGGRPNARQERLIQVFAVIKKYL